MTSQINIQKVNRTDAHLINKIAAWYFDEWTIPVERTTERLSKQSDDDVIFQLVLNKNENPVATGGLYHKVGILMEHEKFKKFGPWVALLYTEPSDRNKGIGKILLEKIEEQAKEKGFGKIYLFTFTAESLYQRSGWKIKERVIYKGHDTVVMEKEI